MEKKRRVALRKLLVIIGATVLLGSQLSGYSWAQPGMGPGGGRPQQGRMWDQKTVETIKGEITGIDKQTLGKKGKREVVRLALKTDKETISVILGPSRYVDKQDIKLAPKDTVEITGSRATIQGQAVILAAEVKKDDKILKLREANGKPVWAGQKRPRQDNK
jgi:hypothetical protein